MKKYSLTKNKKEYGSLVLWQIKAEMSFGNVSKGDLGGWIEKEDNLSQGNNAWVYGNAGVYGKLKLLAGFFFGIRYQKEEIKFKEIDENYELIYKGEAKFGETEDDEVEKAIKLLTDKGHIKDGRIVV